MAEESFFNTIKSSITYRWFRSVFSVVLFFLISVEFLFIGAYLGSYTDSVSEYIASKHDTNMISFQVLLKAHNYDLYSTVKPFYDEITSGNEIMTEIFDTDGSLLVSTKGISVSYNKELDVTPGVSETMYKEDSTGERLFVYTAPLKDQVGKTYAHIRYTTTLDKMFVLEMAVIAVSVLGIAVVAGLVFISGLYFIRSIVRPVETITKSAKQISYGDFSIRIEKKYDDEIGNLSDAINDMASELSKIDKLKNDFISSISHELRTPLTAIRGWNETIEMCDPETDGDLIEKGLNIISIETDRLSTMVEELLDYSKIQSGRFQISKSRIDLLRIMMETLDVYTQRAEQANVSIEFEMPPFEPTIIGDGNRIKQVYINVLDNAIKHTPVGGKISVSFLKAGGGYSVIIKDTGAGISEKDLPMVKERFYKGASTKPGSGLGLSICNEIVTLHGGELNIYSKEGEGTKVVITLPTADVTEEIERIKTNNE